jgi:hypothetical protein
MFETVRYVTRLLSTVSVKLAFSSSNIDKYAAATEDVLNINALLFELLQCRDGSCSLSNKNFNNADITSMIDILCTYYSSRLWIRVIFHILFSFGFGPFGVFFCNFHLTFALHSVLFISCR